MVDFAQLEKINGLPAGLLDAVMWKESEGDPSAVSVKGATGPMQLMPDTAKAYGVTDPTDIEQAAPAAAKMLGERYKDRGGDLAKTLADYNWGMGNVNRQGMEKAPVETRDYIDKITSKMGVASGRDLHDDEISDMMVDKKGDLKKEIANEPTLDQNGKPLMNINIGGKGSDRIADKEGHEKVSDEEITGMMNNPKIGKNSSEDDIIRSFNFDPERIKKSDMYSPGMFKYENVFSDMDTTVGDIKKSGWGTAFKGAQDVITSMEQIAEHGGVAAGAKIDKALGTKIGRDPVNAEFMDLLAKVRQADYDQNWKGRKPGEEQPVGEMLGNAAGSMLVPLAGPGKFAEGMMALSKAAMPVKSLVGKAIQTAAPSAVVGAATAPLLTPVITDQKNGGGFGDAKFKQAKEGAEGGALGGPVIDTIGVGLVKGLNAVKGVMPEAYAELKAVADKYGLWDKLSVGDVSGNSTAQKVENSLKAVPEYLGGTEGKAKELSKAITEVSSKFSAQKYDEMINANFKDIEEIKKVAGNSNHPRHKAALAITERMKADKDFADIVQTSASAVELRARLVSDKNYAKVESLAGEGSVWVVNTNKAIDDTLKTLGRVKGDFADVAKNKIERIKLDIADSKKPNTYAALRETRTAIRSAADDMRRGGDKYTASQMDKIVAGISDDLEKFGSNSKRPDLKAAAQKADNFYKNNVLPLESKRLSRLYDTSAGAEADTIYSHFIQAGKGDRAQNFFNALDDKGRSAVKSGMVDEAIRKATNDKGEFDPSIFSGYFHNIEKAQGVFFKGHDKWELDGLNNLMKHAAPREDGTSAFATGLFANEGMLGNIGISKLVQLSGAATATRWLLTSPVGKRFLLASSDIKPNSPAMTKLVDKIKSQMPKFVARASTSTGAE